MTAVKILMVLLSHEGHWFGGQAGTISVRWATEAPQPEAVLVWDLMLGDVRIASDRGAMATGSTPTVIRITPPVVRVRTTMRWVYRLQQRDVAKELASGEATIQVYPNDLLAGLDKRLEGKRIVVWERSGELAKLLAAAKVPHERIEDASKLQFARADMILAGPEEIDATPFAQSFLLGRAGAGAGVAIFQQTKTPTLGRYALARRAVPAKLEWRSDHPLLQHFEPEDLQSWLSGAGTNLWAVQLPADEPALEVAYWPREVEGKEPVPIDALLVVKAVGQGRVVLCQIPLGSWATDPRSQRFLANGLGFLSTRAEPTPPPSERPAKPVVQPESVPTLIISPGGSQ